jgi:hypothetical protein
LSLAIEFGGIEVLHRLHIILLPEVLISDDPDIA